MTTRKPEILIGYLGMNQHIRRCIDEVMYGIEEEGCLYREYHMGGASDIQYTHVGVTVCITEKKASIYCGDLPADGLLYTSDSDAVHLCRQLGANAARYLKNMPLQLDVNNQDGG